MKLNLKTLLTACLIVFSLALISGCSNEATPYDVNDKENYTVSVKFDANGGLFTTNTSVIVDSFNIEEMSKNGNGEAQAALLSPDNELRGNDAYSATNNGYFLAGWYTERIESKDADGNTVYTYADKWDFDSDLLTVDVKGTYSSAEPVLTLYAAWVPEFEIEFYSRDNTAEPCGTLTFNPSELTEILVPQWNPESGAIEMYEFPARDGYTFNGVYYDEACQMPVEGETVTHTGVVDYETGTAQNGSMKLYVDWLEGEWYHIYTADQFIKNAKVNGSYVIHADLDFTDKIWPTALMHGNFAGTIEGNGYTMKNVQITQTNNSKVNSGLFGNLTENAKISDVTFDNVTFTIEGGTRVVGASFGLFAGTLSNGAQVSDLKITNSTLQIDSRSYFGVDDYTIGLICGMGTFEGMDFSGVRCTAVGDAADTLKITVDGNTVSVEIVSE